jgi:2-polyprenyl-6-methoxyphenol hydroxylase-like FAD-dependent oxidoreductase
MMFGPERQFLEHLGGYLAFFTMPTPADITPGWPTYHSVPGAAMMIRAHANPSTSQASVTMRLPADPALRGDVAAQHELVRAFLSDAKWQAPAVLAALPAAEDFHFDQLARVNMPSLSRGRVVLLGDAGYCGSPLTGMGTAMAIVGAYLLAGEIITAPDDLGGALARHEQRLRPLLAKAQQLPGGGPKFMLPRSALGVRMSRVGMRVMMSRAMRPLTGKMFFEEQPYQLSEYGVLVNSGLGV